MEVLQALFDGIFIQGGWPALSTLLSGSWWINYLFLSELFVFPISTFQNQLLKVSDILNIFNLNSLVRSVFSTCCIFKTHHERSNKIFEGTWEQPLPVPDFK